MLCMITRVWSQRRQFLRHVLNDLLEKARRARNRQSGSNHSSGGHHGAQRQTDHCLCCHDARLERSSDVPEPPKPTSNVIEVPRIFSQEQTAQRTMEQIVEVPTRESWRVLAKLRTPKLKDAELNPLPKRGRESYGM